MNMADLLPEGSFPSDSPIRYRVFPRRDRQAERSRIAAYRDECFVAAFSRRNESCGGVAIACGTALWAYCHIRQRRFYWQDKKLLLRRIFRTVHLRLKKLYNEFPDTGEAVELAVLIIGDRNYWFGSVGGSRLLRVRNGSVLSFPGTEPAAGALGYSRGPVPHRTGGRLRLGDRLVLFALSPHDPLPVDGRNSRGWDDYLERQREYMDALLIER